MEIAEMLDPENGSGATYHAHNINVDRELVVLDKRIEKGHRKNCNNQTCYV